MLKKGDRGEEVKNLQKALYISDDGVFGRGTRNAVIDFQKNNGLGADGIVGEKTLRKLEATTVMFTLPNVYMLKTKPEKIEIPLLGDTLFNAKVNGVNGTFFDTPRPTLKQSCWGIAVNDSKPIGPNAGVTDYKGTKRGTLAYTRDRRLVCERINRYTEIPGMDWGMSGVMLLPNYDSGRIERYLPDIYRRTNHTVIGYDIKGNIYLIMQKNCTMEMLIATCKKFGLISAISVDGGGSSQFRYNGRGYKSSRRINSAVIVRD